ncbi:MAG: extracellular solute-binding protein, partial [Pikeienuella sp.]
MSRVALAFVTALALAAPAAGDQATAHGVSAFGDLKYPEGFTHFDYVEPDAPKGGALRTRSTFALNTFDSLNPYILKGDAPAEIGLYTFDTLMVRAEDEPDAVYGLIASAVTYPEDRAWAEFTLRPEARFSDGEPVTAADVVFSLDILKREGAPAWRLSYAAIESAEALDPHRVRFTFREGAATRDLPMLAATIPVLARHYWEGRDFAASTLEPPVGSGPYRIGRFEPGRVISFERREDYWAKDLNVNRGRWNFDRLVYEYFRDYTAAFEAFKAGAYDLHEEFYSKIWATGYDFPALAAGRVLRETLPDGRPSGTQGYWFNLRREKFADPRVREALALAFDFEWSNRTLFHGLYTRTTSFFQGSPLAAAGRPSPAERALLEPLMADLPPSALDAAFIPPETDGSGRPRRALRQAGAMLDKAGWTVGADGKRRNAAGEALTIEFLDDSPSFERITGPFIKNLTQLGVEATMRTVDAAQFQARTKNYDFDVTIARLPMQPTPGVELWNLFGAEAAAAPDSLNLSGVANPAVDALIEAVIAAKTAEDHAAAVSALDRALRALHIWVPQWSKASHTVAGWDRYGRPAMNPPSARGIVDLWWVVPARDAKTGQGRERGLRRAAVAPIFPKAQVSGVWKMSLSLKPFRIALAVLFAAA